MDGHSIGVIGVIGGTGPQGRGLACRFVLAGHSVILGSRSRARATDGLNALPDSAVVAAFHHVAAATLLDPADHDEHEDVLVCGDDVEAKEIVVKLASTVAGRPGVDGGPLRMARYLEPLTAVLIAINKRYKTRSGIAVTGLRERA